LAQRRGPGIGDTTFRPIFFEESATRWKRKEFQKYLNLFIGHFLESDN
jgi:hypothetical protein